MIERAGIGLGLTRRESEVLALVADGHINASIAVELAISPRTVHKHLERIYAKLSVGTRTAAAARVWELAAAGAHGPIVASPIAGATFDAG